jgi:hypothetical protein
VRHSLELGERWLTKDGVVSTLKVRDHKVDVVGAEVVWIAKLHRERDLPERYGALSEKDAPELCIVRLKISLSLREGKLLRNRMSMELPPSMSTLSNRTLLMQGSRTRGKRPGSRIAAH